MVRPEPYQRVEHLKSALLIYALALQALDKNGKACRGQTLMLITDNSKLHLYKISLKYYRCIKYGVYSKLVCMSKPMKLNYKNQKQ